MESQQWLRTWTYRRIWEGRRISCEANARQGQGLSERFHWWKHRQPPVDSGSSSLAQTVKEQVAKDASCPTILVLYIIKDSTKTQGARSLQHELKADGCWGANSRLQPRSFVSSSSVLSWQGGKPYTSSESRKWGETVHDSLPGELWRRLGDDSRQLLVLLILQCPRRTPKLSFKTHISHSGLCLHGLRGYMQSHQVVGMEPSTFYILLLTLFKTVHVWWQWKTDHILCHFIT